MREIFKGVVELNDKEISSIIDTGLIVLDTNVLLDLYRLSNSSREDWLHLIQKLTSRVFLPYQIGLEFHRNRLVVIKAVKKENDGFSEKLKIEFDKLKNILGENKRIKDHLGGIEDFRNKLWANIKKDIASYPDFIKKDSVYEILDKVFTKNIGKKPEYKRVKELEKEAEQRFQSKIPPGFQDKDKEDSRYFSNSKFGDVILWFQMIEIASEKKNNLLFVTRDNKDDWWEKVNGEKIGPHPLLREEFYDKSGMFYHQLSPERFISIFRDKFPKEIKDTTVSETANVSVTSKDIPYYSTKNFSDKIINLLDMNSFDSKTNWQFFTSGNKTNKFSEEEKMILYKYLLDHQLKKILNKKNPEDEE